MSNNMIHLISGPRNISTALMYAFGNRIDTTIVDEPMYGVYLKMHDVDHPGKEEILNDMEMDIELVKKNVFHKSYQTSNVFIKNMAHHFIDIDHRFIFDYHNIFLIRDPKQLISSFAEVISFPTMQDIGIEKEYIMYLELNTKCTHKPIVIDSNEILKDPRHVLKQVCEKIDIPFSERMLKWESGPRSEDGIWAKYWYDNVHKSTSFRKQQPKDRILPSHLEPLYEKAKYFYDKLFEYSIKA